MCVWVVVGKVEVSRFGKVNEIISPSELSDNLMYWESVIFLKVAQVKSSVFNKLNKLYIIPTKLDKYDECWKK